MGVLAFGGVLACSEGAPERGVDGAAVTVDTGRVAVPGSSIYYESAGEGAPVILLHGGNLDRRMWDAEFAVLRLHSRVIRYDARGFGRSGPADSSFAAHDDLLALMQALELPRASLIGLSLGGRIAIDFTLTHPRMVERLVLAAPGISGGTWAEDGDTTWLVAGRAAAKAGDSVALARAWLESAYIRTALRDSATAPGIRAMALDNARMWAGLMKHGDLERQLEPAAATRLSELRVPVLLLIGSDDTPFIQDVARAIAAEAPDVRRTDLPGIGHMVNLEAPEAFRDAVLAFLARKAN